MIILTIRPSIRLQRLSRRQTSQTYLNSSGNLTLQLVTVGFHSRIGTKTIDDLKNNVEANSWDGFALWSGNVYYKHCTEA